MRKIMHWVFAAILICGTSVFTACNDNTDNPVPEMSNTIALIVKNGDLEYFQQIESAFRSACNEKNVVPAYFATSEENAWQEQVAAVEKLRSLSGTKLKGIIFAPSYGPNGECADAAVDALASQLGIPVVILDSRVNETSPLINCPFFGIDNAAAGRELAQQIKADNIASFAVLNSPGVERANGFKELKPNTTFAEISENSTEEVQAVMGDNQTFVFFNGSALFPSFPLLKEAGKEVYTFDIYETFLDELIAGNSCLKGIMVQNTFLMTRKAVDAILSGATEGELVPTFFMTRNNLNDPEVKPFLEFYNKQVPPIIENLAEKIVGKWETDQLYGQPALTNNKVVLTFESGTKAFMSAAINSSPDVVILWMNREEVGCTIEGNIVTLVEQIGENMSGVVTLQVTSINDNELVGQISQKIFSGELQIVTIPEHPVHYKKVSVDYNSQVVGLWECVEMTGEETYNDANARLDFKADGTYDYYQKVNDEWTLVPNREVNQYNVDGEWFATRWKSTDGPMLYEWWDIVSIGDGVMVWNGLRQKTGGERFTTTYRWKKVEN